MAKGYCYLRPSADISVGHSLIPTDSSNAYSLINEEVLDIVTYIKANPVSGETVVESSTFRMSGVAPADTRCIIDAKVYCILYSATTQVWNVVANINGKSFELTGYAEDANALTSNIYIYTSEAFVEELRSYNSVPEIDITLTSSVTLASDSKNYTTYGVCQMYIEVEYNNGVRRKVNNEWKPSHIVYQKINGIWTQLENGYNVVGSKLHRMGHHQEYLPAIAKTCTENGTTEGYKCSMCGEIFVPQTIIPASHEYVTYGQHNICSICSHVENIGRVIFPLKNYSEIDPLSNAKCFVNNSCETLGNYAIFAGGYNYENNSIIECADIDAYDTSFTKIKPTDLTGSAPYVSTTLGNYAVFSDSGSTATSAVDVYDTSLVKTVLTWPEQAYRGKSVTTLGGYAIFAGGQNFSSSTLVDSVSACNTSLTRTSLTPLSTARYSMGSTTLGNYAIFAGGYNNGYLDCVDVYNTSLTKITASPLQDGSGKLVGMAIGNYAIFGVQEYSMFHLFDTSLTSIYNASNTDSYFDMYCNSATLISHVLFNGYHYIRSFDVSLTCNKLSVEFARPYDGQVPNGIDGIGMTVLNGYILFAGGLYSYSTTRYAYNNVYAYKLYE